MYDTTSLSLVSFQDLDCGNHAPMERKVLNILFRGSCYLRAISHPIMSLSVVSGRGVRGKFRKGARAKEGRS